MESKKAGILYHFWLPVHLLSPWQDIFTTSILEGLAPPEQAPQLPQNGPGQELPNTRPAQPPWSTSSPDTQCLPFPQHNHRVAQSVFFSTYIAAG